MASIAGFDVDLLDDVRLAVSEALLALVEVGNGEDMGVTFELRDGGFQFSASTESDRSDLAEGLDLCRAVLQGITTRYDVKLRHGDLVITAELRDTAL